MVSGAHFQKELSRSSTSVFSRFVKDWGFIHDGDLETIGNETDFLGINYYSGGPVQYKEDDPLLHVGYPDSGRPKTGMGWEIYPEDLYNLLKRLEKEYTGQLPLYITENGAAYPDHIRDYETQQRIPKSSALRFSKACRGRGRDSPSLENLELISPNQRLVIALHNVMGLSQNPS
jgi:beta-glucosidase/6-phospho-beta-glucosidase/beta-galactosidase